MARDPLYRWVPEFEETYGDLAAGLAEQVGMVMDEEQRDILDAIYAEDEPGIPTCFEVAVVAPRQNIKTSTLEIAALTDVFVLGLPEHVWTAHQFSTTQKSFDHMVKLVAGCEDLRRRCVWPPRASHGEQAIELLTGEKIEFRARSRGGGRGFTAVSRITFDEALFLAGTAMGALLPTLATIRGAQVRYGSSAGFEFSDALRSIRNRGRKGGDPRLAYIEHGAPRVKCLREDCSHVFTEVQGKGCALDREDLWFRANLAMHPTPGAPPRIHIETMRSFRRTMPPEEFSREFLSWWEDPPEDGVEHAIDIDAWKARRDPASVFGAAVTVGPLALGIEVSPRRVATISVCGWRPDGRKHGEEIWSGPSSAAVAVLKKIIDKKDPATLVIDSRGKGGSLLPDIRAAGYDPQVLTSVERSHADEGLVRDVDADELRLPAVPMPDTDAAAESATWRYSGDVRYFDRRAGGAGISQLVALSLARHGLLTVAAQPPKPTPPAPVAIGDLVGVATGGMDISTVGF